MQSYNSPNLDLHILYVQIHVFTMPIPYPLCLGPVACPRPWAGRPGGSSRCAGSRPGRPPTGPPPSSAPPAVSWRSARAPKLGLPGQTGPLMEIFSGASSGRYLKKIDISTVSISTWSYTMVRKPYIN